MDQKEVLKNRQYRGQIMRIVAMFYPDPVTVKQLKLALQEYGMIYTSEIDKHIHFLADDSDKESPPYIRRADGFIKELTDNDKIYITKAGIRLIEGSIQDDDVVL
ncbi:MAG: hypothetical protein E6230_02670 [Paenibacillus dendritiformis]|uniref:hypothetical protein n=1 Tax=uncultured Paenibacillus sp. TaxID=227322 RepID=UPI0025F6D73B|nr:hypothetical protein [uncultured Paenibacillus sp.]MDU5141077.1 hypothetical protein [Paenibacillus dendritiformis]